MYVAENTAADVGKATSTSDARSTANRERVQTTWHHVQTSRRPVQTAEQHVQTTEQRRLHGVADGSHSVGCDAWRTSSWSQSADDGEIHEHTTAAERFAGSGAMEGN